jgi:hypothetical protein
MVVFTDAEWAGVLDMVGRIARGEQNRATFLANTDLELARYKAAYHAGDVTRADRLRRIVMVRDQVELLTRPEGARR